MSSSALLRAIRGALFLGLVLAARDAAFGQSNPPPAVKPTPEPTPIPLASVPAEIQSAMTTLQETEASVTRVRASTDAIADRLAKLTGETEPRMAEDSVLLQGNPSLDMLYRTKLSWQDFKENLAVLSRELTQHTISLDEELARLKELSKSWQTTLQTARQENVPPEALQSIQDFVNSIEQARQSVEGERGRALTELNRISDEETRVRKILSLVDQTQGQALKDLLVRDSPFIWSPKRGLGTEWEVRSGASFASQFKAATAFGKRLPWAFFLHAVLIVLLAIGLRWVRRAVLSRAKEKPELARALPILDLPVATAFVLTVLVSPWIYPEAPRLIQVLLGTLALIPAVLILRRLLDRKFAPILYFLVAMYFIDQLRVLAASLPELVRFLFLAQMLGASLFLLWLLRSRQLAATAEKTSARFTNAVHAICIIGLILLPAAIVANIFGYLNLAYLLGMIFLRSVYIAALLYTAIRILEGLIIIALEVRPLGSLRVVALHRSLLLQRACEFFQFVALLFWLHLMLGFFGLLNPLLAGIQAALNASFAIGSLGVSLGGILAFVIAIWASFLVSRFVRFILEEDVYSHLLLERGIPYAISTMLHYAILLLGFFIALGALGIDLTKITILAGAFSVGIGFGLQNIINNFVSGLILLFERPIKIGDIIEVGGNVGEVQRIGIRASIIRTSNGSEVIVPNGSLISTQVTNWTLSDRGRAIEVMVSVASGTNLPKVAELLKSVAMDQPDVAKKPAPQVHLTSMTAGAVAFQVRVWTERSEAWAEIRSDLSLAINERLARENIPLA